jgi:hypothetical protein
MTMRRRDRSTGCRPGFRDRPAGLRPVFLHRHLFLLSLPQCYGSGAPGYGDDCGGDSACGDHRARAMRRASGVDRDFAGSVRRTEDLTPIGVHPSRRCESMSLIGLTNRRRRLLNDKRANRQTTTRLSATNQ